MGGFVILEKGETLGEGSGGEGYYLDALGESMADGEFSHVVLLLAQADEIVVDTRLVLARVVEVEVLRLHVVLGQLLALKLGNLLEKTLLVLQRHPPDHYRAVVEEEHFGRVYLRVEVRRLCSFVLR